MKKILCFLFIISVLCSGMGFASSKSLVEINGKVYTEKQFDVWWKYWKDKHTPFPENVQPFIDWILLSDEAKTLGLDKEPSYVRKLKIFREVRSLLQIRYDEVEKKIDINPDNLWVFYKKEFAPQYRIEAIISRDFNEIKEVARKIKTEKDFKLYFEKFFKNKKAKDLGYQRPLNIPKVFKNKILESKKGEIIGPVKYKGSYFILLVEDILPPDKEDYNKIHKNVAVRFKKSEEGRLTDELLKRLRKKYSIYVDWEAIEKISPFDNLSEDLAKKKVIKIEDNFLTAAQFQKNLKRDVELRIRGKKIPAERLKRFKQSVVNNSINQTLTSLEGLNRHYEKTVMKDIYWFYKRNRLIKELEAKIIAPQVKVSEKEIKKYYEKNKKDFLKPETAEIAVIQTKDKKLIKSAIKRIKSGEDFFEVARDVQFHGALPETRRIDSLVKEVRDAVVKMKDGNISKIIKYKEWFFLVKLVKKERAKLHEFSKVKESIRKMLYSKKLMDLKNSYLNQLRKKSRITINKVLWKEISDRYKTAKHKG